VNLDYFGINYVRRLFKVNDNSAYNISFKEGDFNDIGGTGYSDADTTNKSTPSDTVQGFDYTYSPVGLDFNSIEITIEIARFEGLDVQTSTNLSQTSISTMSFITTIKPFRKRGNV
jgi:hypothetical protein